MVNAPLASSLPTQPQSPPAYQEAQLALAVADEGFLRSLLTDSLPALVHPHEVGTVTVDVGVPMDQGRIDAVLKFEHISCVLAGSYAAAPPPPPVHTHTQYQAITTCHSDLTTLAQNVPISTAVEILARAGFAHDQIHHILHLPSQAWHKSWWYTLDLDGFLTVPFQRSIRTRCFADGTVTLQFKDYYAYERPEGFRSEPRQLPVIIHMPHQSFCDNLAQINRTRQTLGTGQALLIADDLTELEIEGYIRQNVSLFRQQGMESALQANCHICQQPTCPMRGSDASPVLACRAFQPTEVMV